jgi:glycosyltransferase involved in cell wall biosynthesis
MVVPCYNESEVLAITAKTLMEKYASLIATKKISKKSRIVFVDDGSKDDTWEQIVSLHKTNEIFSGIRLSRNRGHQNALIAGLYKVSEYCDISITIDADLQDDINTIDEMLIKYSEGNDIVYAARDSRATDSIFKRSSAGFFISFKLF